MAASAHSTASPSFSSLYRSRRHDSSPSHRPMRINIPVNKPSHSMSIDHEVEFRIEKALSERGQEYACVTNPMHHLAFAAPRGKLPSLCVGACEIFGGRREDAITAASALHLMYSAALAHENLPLSDDQPNDTIHHTFDANMELLTGDCLLPLGYELLAELGHDSDDTERVLRVIVEVSKAMGSQGIVEGQYTERQREKRSEKWVYKVSEKKEGGLYACGAACGAILGGGSDDEVEKLRKYGFCVGMMDGMMRRGVGLMEDEKLHQLVHRFRCLALEEVDSIQDRNVHLIRSLIDGDFHVNQPSPTLQ